MNARLLIIVREDDILVEVQRTLTASGEGETFDVMIYETWEELLQRIGQGWIRTALKIRVR